MSWIDAGAEPFARRVNGMPASGGLPWGTGGEQPADRPWDAPLPGPPMPKIDHVAKRLVLIPLVAALIGSSLGAGVTLALTKQQAPQVQSVDAKPLVSAGGSLTGVAAVAQAVIPSVVQVDVTSSDRFGRQALGTGSGVVYRSDGYIITNAHVVDSGGSIKVTLSTGETVPATLVGTGSGDVAVLKVDRTNLVPANFGTTSGLHVGDVAVAIGSPFGLEGTVTSGVVSALDREIQVDRGSTLTNLLQTDAPINPGNSGGALVNANAQVIGINTAAVDGGGGVGFAISIDAVLKDVQAILGSRA
jgi:putative serine protease PepD